MLKWWMELNFSRKRKSVNVMYTVLKDIQVRYGETDQMGVVYHANYIIWFELGRTELINSLGLSYVEMEEKGIISPVIDVQASYKKPVRYGDKVKVRTYVKKYDGIRVTYHYEVINGNDEVCVTGESVHICVRKESFRPIAIRKHLPEWHEAYEKVKVN